MKNEEVPAAGDQRVPEKPPVKPPILPKEKRKPNPEPPPHKRGPSIDIAPSIGPGPDVVATPPKRI